MSKLYGQIKLKRLYGDVNIVPSNVSSANLIPLTIYPSHDRQVFATSEDDDFDGFSVVTAEPVPRLPACVVSVTEGEQATVETVVNIGVGVSVTGEDVPVYTHALYNGVRLPIIPENELEGYPYAIIFSYESNYKLVLAEKKWFKTDSNTLQVSSCGNADFTSDGTDWGTGSYYTSVGNWPVDGLIWSNHDIPNGSADATEVYFAGSEPVPTD